MRLLERSSQPVVMQWGVSECVRLLVRPFGKFHALATLQEEVMGSGKWWAAFAVKMRELAVFASFNLAFPWVCPGLKSGVKSEAFLHTNGVKSKSTIPSPKVQHPKSEAEVHSNSAEVESQRPCYESKENSLRPECCAGAIGSTLIA